MIATQAGGRQITSAEELFDLARSIADRSSDPDATYESFLLGLEMGMSCGDLKPVIPQVADRESVYSQREDRVISDPRKPMIRKAPPRRVMSSGDFPTEWTLDP